MEFPVTDGFSCLQHSIASSTGHRPASETTRGWVYNARRESLICLGSGTRITPAPLLEILLRLQRSAKPAIP
jgi:hypothetical protein